MAAAPSACSSSRRYTSRGSPTKQTAESIDKLIANAEMNLISTTPGAVPPHVDDGGHLPFGGMIGGTRGPSAFGKRKLTTANALGNPQALLLNYPPEPTPANLRCWERNCACAARMRLAGKAIPSHCIAEGYLPRESDKSSLYLDPSIEGERLITTNHLAYGFPKEPSYLADQNRTWGNLRQTSFTRPTPSPKYFPPPRSNTPASAEATTYTWKWPAREVRPPAPTLKRPEKVSYSFLEEYELRPPWLKY